MAEDAIFSILSGDTQVSSVVGTRIYPQVAPQNGTLPYIIYNRVTSDHIEDLQGGVGLVRGTYEIDCWSVSYDTTRSLAETVRLAMQGFRGTSAFIPIGGVNMTDNTDVYVAPQNAEEPGMHGAQMDFNIWFGDEPTNT